MRQMKYELVGQRRSEGVNLSSDVRVDCDFYSFFVYGGNLTQFDPFRPLMLGRSRRSNEAQKGLD